MSKIDALDSTSTPTADTSQQDNTPKFTPEEISDLLKEANGYKAAGNELFRKEDYADAIVEYQKALDTCPIECVEERAIYRGNLGNCEFQLGKYLQAVDTCTKALEDSPRYTKALFRRAQANEKIGTFTALTSAQEDYNALLNQSSLAAATKKQISTSLDLLPAQISEAQEREKAEMLGKLKDLGNMFLGKFGLSSDNFQMVKNEKTGGYNIQFAGGNSSTSSVGGRDESGT